MQTKRPQVTLDDLDTWWVIYRQFIGTVSEYDIHFGLNNDLEAQDSYKIKLAL